MRLLVNPTEPIRNFRDEPLTTVYRRWICRADCDGEMKPTGEALMSYPPQYPHRCEKCRRQEVSNVVYPRVAYLPIESLEVDIPAPGQALPNEK